MATVTITIEDRADGCDVKAVCSGAGEEVTPAMLIAYNFLKLAGESVNEMPQVQQSQSSLRNEAVH